MIYMYDKILRDDEVSFKAYGGTYSLEKKYRMGKKVYYSFISPGREKILLIPGFYEEYLEVEKKYEKLKNLRQLPNCIKRIRAEISRAVNVEMFESSENASGKMPVITVDYKDIKVTFEFRKSRLLLLPEFTIVKGNIFGNNILVILEEGE